MVSYKKEIKWLLSEKYNNKLTAQAWEDIHKLKRGEPLDYLIGYVDFLGCKIDLSKKPLIPRPETEYWVERVIKGYKGTRLGRTPLLDIFAGSGCIGISILRHLPNSTVIFSDSEDNCLEQIEINCKLNKIDSKRYKIIKSDVFKKIPKKEKFDYIFANPPYIPTHSKDIEQSVLINEPASALFGGEDGLTYIRKFLRDAKNYFSKDGKIFMEFDHPQKNQVRDILKKHGYTNYEFKKDQFNKWRYLEKTRHCEERV
ncbi:peptide chain release factor N(5)-glutamine methyltransferase [Patescibacteria group bacterium]|nr:peptide chain release factor N(5)-glutamine methyltransferase [Patescibacteria group bacterium]